MMVLERDIYSYFNSIHNKNRYSESDYKQIVYLINNIDTNNKYIINLIFIKLSANLSILDNKDVRYKIPISFFLSIIHRQSSNKIINNDFFKYVDGYQRSYILMKIVSKVDNNKKLKKDIKSKYVSLIKYLIENNEDRFDYERILSICKNDKQLLITLLNIIRKIINNNSYNKFIKNLHHSIKEKNKSLQTPFMNGIRIRDRFKVLFGII